MQETNANGTKDYAYDHRGNLLSVTSGEEVLRAYGFDAANQMNSSMGMTDGQIKKAVYQYNGLGHRMEQSIAAGDAAPEQTIRYTLDLTRQYHNLLQKTENNVQQTYFWDGNVTGMEEEGREHFYFQDDLGSPMRLADEAGRSEETYGFDEFGNDIRTAKDIFKDSLQSFGFTGYQMDSAGGLYFAQARGYDAGVGRFVSEDFIKGHIAVPYTMNHYNYCWNRPMDLVDLNGMWPTLKDIGEGINSVGEFIYNHKQQITGGLIIGGSVLAAGVVSCIPVVGNVAAGAILGAGVDAGMQYITNGEINTKEVVVSGIAGGILSFVPGVASGLTNLMTNIGTSKIKTAFITGIIEAGLNAIIGSATSVITDIWANGKKITDESVWKRATINGMVAAGGSAISSVLNNTVGKSISDKILKNKISEDVYRHSARSQDYDMGALMAWKNSNANCFKNIKNFWTNIRNWYDINLNWIMNVGTQMVSNNLTQMCSFNE